MTKPTADGGALENRPKMSWMTGKRSSRKAPRETPDGTPLPLRCEVLYASGHLEQLEVHVNKTRYFETYLHRTIGKEAQRYVGVDPLTYSTPYFILNCVRVLDNGAVRATPLRNWEMDVLDLLREHDQLDLWELRRHRNLSAIGRSLLPVFLVALRSAGRVEFEYNQSRTFGNTVRWIGGGTDRPVAS